MRRLLLLIILAIVCIAVVHSADTTANFRGKQYVEYEIENQEVQTRKDKVTMRFKTTEAYGVLLYSCGGQGDYLLVELQRGKIV